MFNRKTEEIINDAIEAETREAEKNYGKKYASKHEAYAVLKEEIEECKEEIDKIKTPIHLFWLSVRGRQKDINVDNYSDTKQINIIKSIAINTAKEALQVAAVCNKILSTIK